MWKYYVYANCLVDKPLLEKADSLFRVDGYDVERYEGGGRWIVSPYSGEILLDISGAGGNWADVDIITAEEAEQVKKRLFPEG